MNDNIFRKLLRTYRNEIITDLKLDASVSCMTCVVHYSESKMIVMVTVMECVNVDMIVAIIVIWNAMVVVNVIVTIVAVLNAADVMTNAITSIIHKES